MSVNSIPAFPTTVPTPGQTQDLGDLVFAIALLQMQMIDGEITDRLTKVKQINEVRKAYGERISQLNEMIKGAKGSDVWMPAEQAQRVRYEWDPAASGGRGGVVEVADGTPIGVDSQYRLRHPNGRVVTEGELRAARERAEGVEGAGGGRSISGKDLDRGVVLGPDGEVVNGAGPWFWPVFPFDSLPQDFRSLSEANAAAALVGGGVTVEVKVSKDSLKAEIDTIRDKMDGLSSDTEMGMLQINRLLNRRNQGLQLASNVMSSVHQSAMGIINNIKV
ncbi:MAG: hypothetical protein QME96_10295 [Myxococcota bacterium]|nr:hypothetical protein [Myxococcota bacterium]